MWGSQWPSGEILKKTQSLTIQRSLRHVYADDYYYVVKKTDELLHDW